MLGPGHHCVSHKLTPSLEVAAKQEQRRGLAGSESKVTFIQNDTCKCPITLVHGVYTQPCVLKMP
jgi:hypothetical protein